MRKNHISVLFFKAAIPVLFAMTLIGCDRNRNNPGWDYFPDMFYSTAYESYTANPNFRDSMTMRVPSGGTVPRDFTPFEYTIAPESRIKAGIELVNPVPSSPESIERGKNAYTIFCVGCHGVSGEGDGFLYTSKLYTIKPRPLATGSAINLKDGEIFHSISVGFGSMGPHESQISSVDRWNIVLYIRSLQNEAKGQVISKK